MVNHYEVDVIFQDIEHQLQESILHHFLHYSFLRNLYLIEKYLQSTQNYLLEAFCDITQPYKLFTSHY